MTATASRADELLRAMLGPNVRFRDGQLEAILATVDERARTLLVQRTGWGKSLVYFIATKIIREQGLGPALLISPLLSLMRNQVEGAERIGIRAARMDSDTVDAWDAIESRLAADEIDVLLVSPERLANDRFQTRTIPQIRLGLGLLVVDEAHCISDWGHDFRPDYRRIVRIVQGLPANVPMLATTATANNRVVADVQAQIGDALRVSRGPLTRDSLRLQAIRLPGQASRLAWLAQHLPGLPGSGIVYCLTTADCDRVAAWLRHNGIDAAAYHAQMPQGMSREALEQRLLKNEVKALVASVALGMGFDKPDLGFVVHYQRPGSLIAYYQQIGRAGRSVPEAYAVLLSGREDDEIQEYFIRHAFPGVEALTSVLGAVEAADTAISTAQLERKVNLRRGKLEQCLKFLEVDGAVAREGSKYFRTANPWNPDVTRFERVTATRHEELAAIQAFVDSRSCLMEFVAQALDDPHARPCGHCAVCRHGLLAVDIDQAIAQRAVEFLRRSHRVIEPRVRWGSTGLVGRTGNIAAELRASTGQALCMWGDAGWGARVREGKYQHGRFDDELVDACVEMIRDEWRPEPLPGWVTAVPSSRRPVLVPDFAARLAAKLGLPFVECLRKIRETPPQKTMENSAQQMANIAETFEVVGGVSPLGPVLLVDDTIDSRWTLTECAFVLRSAGSGPVHPLALAMISGGGDAS
ncbi:MAG: RecQ family ATP-dependent DNA helicase [Acidobacteriota bacterium]|nr:RecQ family ATP-dependent DNA helicase [Acidobacteriota bacterium]